MAVQENRLESLVLTTDDYAAAIESPGRGWVIEDDDMIVAFAVGNAETGNIWALFVDPGHDHRGHGRRLHDTMVEWLEAQGIQRLWLTTEPGTRAERFYVAAGWRPVRRTSSGEILFERIRNAGDGSTVRADRDWSVEERTS